MAKVIVVQNKKTGKSVELVKKEPLKPVNIRRVANVFSKKKA